MFLYLLLPSFLLLLHKYLGLYSCTAFEIHKVVDASFSATIADALGHKNQYRSVKTLVEWFNFQIKSNYGLSKTFGKTFPPFSHRKISFKKKKKLAMNQHFFLKSSFYSL